MGTVAHIRARDRLLAASAAELPSPQAYDVVVQAFHDVARFDWCALMTTDPATLLPSGGVVEGFSADACAPFWDNELLDPDFLKFSDLARSRDPVGTLHEATDGDLHRSPRYTRLYAGIGAADELRVAFMAGASCIAVGAFVRPAAEGPFSPEELSDVRTLVPVATKLLLQTLSTQHTADHNSAPVVILIDAAGKVEAISDGCDEVLDDIRIGHDIDELPGFVRAAAVKARWGRTSSNLTTRVLGSSGRWRRIHIAPVRGDAGKVMVTIEPASSCDLAQVLLDSYGLTPRETEIVLCLCRGLPSKEIARELMISAHTVRDHIKVIFGKAGVNSRGELVANLFTGHILDGFHSTVTHVANPA
jgi:DNA-binding CsgD family transcriptional regulator